MESEIEADGILLDVLAGLPRVAGFTATIPDEKRGRALEAAERSYLKTARELGYEEANAQQWVSAVMLHLRIVAGESSAKELDPLA